MKSIISAAVCAAVAAVLCSCSKGQYLAVEYNRQSRVYVPIADAGESDAAYSFDLYQNPNLPLKQYGSGIYYYFMSAYDGYTPPMLSVIDPSSGDVRTLCTDALCYQNKVNYTTRCILCDIYDATRLAMRDGCIYYARADKSYFNKSAGKLDYVINSPLDTADEVEFEYTLIEYDLASGKYKDCHTVEPGGYIDFITAYKDYVYFYETAYELIEGQEFCFSTLKKDMDGIVTGSYWFKDDLTGEYVLYDATLFYDRATAGDAPYINIKTNRRMLLKENHPWVKVYKLQRLNAKTKKVETLATRDALPGSFDIFDGRIYELRGDGYYSYDLDYHTEYESTARPGVVQILNAGQAENCSSFQYDQFTGNIYYIKESSLSKVKKAGEAFRGVRTADLCEGEITWYQLTFGGIYFMIEGDYNIYFAEYTDVNYDSVPYTAVFSPDAKLLDKNGSILWPTVVGDFLYYAQCADDTFVSSDGSKTKVAPVISGPYRFSFKTGETVTIWPEGWELSS